MWTVEVVPEGDIRSLVYCFHDQSYFGRGCALPGDPNCTSFKHPISRKRSARHIPNGWTRFSDIIFLAWLIYSTTAGAFQCMCCTASISALIDVSLPLPDLAYVYTSEVALSTSHTFQVQIMSPLGTLIDAAHMIEGNTSGERFA
jgi:hypothetical protein